jgi:hypothetical protein
MRGRAFRDFGLGQLGQSPPGKVEFFDVVNPVKDAAACMAMKDFKPYFGGTYCCKNFSGTYRCRPIAAAGASKGGGGGGAAASSEGGKSEGQCLRTVQQMLYDSNLLEYQWVDGKWNPRTSTVLQQQLGAGWEKTPGGPCALVGVLQARFGAAQQLGPGYAPGGGGGFYPGQKSGFFDDLTTDPTKMLMAGLAVVALVMVAKR